MAILLLSPCANSQVSPHGRAPVADQDEGNNVEAELQTAFALTRQGRFNQAIPHLLAARGKVRQNLGLEFNLALCYVGTRQFASAIEILRTLNISNPGNANINNLLAQALIGSNQLPEALKAFQEAVKSTPNDEKLYALIADACMQNRQYALGADVTEIGLKHLPRAAKLHYQKGMFLVQLDRFAEGKPELDLASSLGKDTEIAFLAAAQKAMAEDKLSEVIPIARDGIKKGFATASLLAMLGEALARNGANPGHPEFDEAVASLEKSLALRAGNPEAQVALGKLYIAGGRLKDAIACLEDVRVLEPENTAVYSNLAKAYRRHGEIAKAQEMLSILSALNQKQAETIRSAPGERKSSYLGSKSERP